ncbi:MAG TPA: flagellar basal body rod protein FlgB [Pseudolabrys sp.]|nr:flagellar basal body rod protein FlgB [Pseudolabrys sp.]
MGVTDVPILSMLRSRMDWAQERQRVLAENVANADTPNYRARDLVAPKFDEQGSASAGALMPVALLRTQPGHMGGAGFGSDAPTTGAGYEQRPTGNAVNIEDEMMKVAANQMDYQAVTALYTRSVNLLKTALGKR